MFSTMLDDLLPSDLARLPLMEMHDMYGHAKLLALLVLLLPTSVSAETHENIIRKFDTNDDAAIDSREHAAFSEAEFGKIDVNRNGRFDVGENLRYMVRTYEADLGPASPTMLETMRRGATIVLMDSDDNGAVSPAEYKAHSDRVFDAQDWNRDKRLTLEEMKGR